MLLHHHLNLYSFLLLIGLGFILTNEVDNFSYENHTSINTTYNISTETTIIFTNKFETTNISTESLSLYSTATATMQLHTMQQSNTKQPSHFASTDNIKNSSINENNFEDYHRYYTSHFVKMSPYWVDLETLSKAGKHPSLSESYRSAATITLSFPFKFYGHEINQITIATGGFLYVSDFLHQWLTATQYIAPLMANFDTQIGNNSHIRYWDSGSLFVVWWEDVYLQDEHSAGKFNFQVVLHVNGTIIFNYKEVPTISISSINHKVTVGLSDAFALEEHFFLNLKQRTIYEYHRVEINISMITNQSSIIINPLPSCIEFKSCGECVIKSKETGFDCQWCPAINHCSDGMDRKRQQWLQHQCDKSYVSSINDCKFWNHKFGNINIASFSIFSFAILMFICIVVWIIYAYRNPNSPSGLWFIEHHPSYLIARIRTCFRHIRSIRIPHNKFNVAMRSEVESLASA